MSLKSFAKGLCKGVGLFVAGCISVPLAIAAVGVLVTGLAIEAVGAIVGVVVTGASVCTCCCAPCVAAAGVYCVAAPIMIVGELVSYLGVGLMVPLAATIGAAEGCCVCDDSDDFENNNRVEVSDIGFGDRFRSIARQVSIVPKPEILKGKTLGEQVEGQPDNPFEGQVEGQPDAANHDLERGGARKKGVTHHYNAHRGTAPKIKTVAQGRPVYNEETLKFGSDSESGTEYASVMRYS